VFGRATMTLGIGPHSSFNLEQIYNDDNDDVLVNDKYVTSAQ